MLRAARYIPLLLLLLPVSGALPFASCASDKPPVAPAITLRDSVPVMTSYGVSKLISDSGVIRYKIVAEEWKVYDRTSPSKQTFEKGLLMEQFNEQFHIQMYIVADTAFWYNNNLWELRGRVCVWNDDGTIFRSELLFWDMNRKEFYSNRHSHLISPTREVEGESFRSNETMTKYEVNATSASFPLPEDLENENAVPADSLVQDTLPPPPPEPERTVQPRRAVMKAEPLPDRPPGGHFK